MKNNVYKSLFEYKNNFFKLYNFSYNAVDYTLRLLPDFSFIFKKNKTNFLDGKLKLTILRNHTFIAELNDEYKFLISLLDKKITFLNYSENNILPIVEYSNE